MRTVLILLIVVVFASCKEKEDQYKCVCNIPSKSMSDTTFVSAKNQAEASDRCTDREIRWGANGIFDAKCIIYY